MDRQRDKIVFIGAGNVAWHLAQEFDKTCHVIQVWSRNKENAMALTRRLKNADAVDCLSNIIKDADFYLVSVTDDAIPLVAKELKDVKGIVAHTSGSFSLKDFKDLVGNDVCGVIYPLQTFSKASALDVSNVPFLIEGSNPQIEKILSGLALRVSPDVRAVDSQSRRYAHISAVFANNFTNFMWDMAEDHLKKNTDLDFSVLRPLLTETLRKAIDIGPFASQTGPAVRGDRSTIEAHIRCLDSDQQEIYQFISKRIYSRHNRCMNHEQD